ncbi:Crp/Fnr family transcriptional regulator [Parapedobacter sp. ISTM3]|uniref:cAMP-binding domain of CRP or a regulatory subunit of cAMP-dependent protein kinases n=1 Tax=Parapedobacter luteus TaxID=623280 RepID=A0A1T5D8P3_9SPHI|nr:MULTISPECIES: Crp/Fnr family transcriptional regulator [Parapedobacter]MBK1438526.1 Crp/Fnr family transcriptional regulator [Parapedobacter sp. ISTM3]SKB68148.1 cAMP-binding domain of CRP or a regulatory subunit of cAMP-dependent protein kinases [Parapedobacter luteus]
MFAVINDYVSRCANFSPDDLAVFNRLLKAKSVKRKQLLLRQGEVCDFEAYIVKGCIRTYYIDENGSEVILQFAVEDWWVSDIGSFHEHKPSLLYIEAMEDSELLTLNPSRKEELLAKVPKFERVFRLMVQRHLSALEHRLIRTIAQTAEERYLEFVRQYPKIVLRVPQHYIASYLGMTPEFLSKVRKRLATRKD